MLFSYLAPTKGGYYSTPTPKRISLKTGLYIYFISRTRPVCTASAVPCRRPHRNHCSDGGGRRFEPLGVMTTRRDADAGAAGAAE